MSTVAQRLAERLGDLESSGQVLEDGQGLLDALDVVEEFGVVFDGLDDGRAEHPFFQVDHLQGTWSESWQ